ncbi:hypothetical protein SERLA73DRAFT_161075 [Serpula lacrymans var. lacrymans S7.3]|uniref:Heterokaryon incompatibility domain-containing protein n=2 Tax=Serpula lacrymans var. lacrymans TaxID=341189 RepID=F8Q1K9_SERL3|nr:uncharacterized protein SERLADRAFT_416122 [Serpula lacrymans var. lacrymans S7.9]EGN98187.1 hypothetical protein SERLA73DRAFT_161075 [Serpula lacrymans var. lacrymans S7.3]EGO23764.1 hypothetical protein SERLADRAFT_416122 [Serpula lacrymans var. lacrymans S7.9]
MATILEIFGSSHQEHKVPSCRDWQLKPNHHDHQGGQRYVSPTTGKCKKLVVQSVFPKGDEVKVNDQSAKSSKLAVWLVENPPTSFEDILQWLGRWAWFALALIWPFDRPEYTGHYKPYLLRYWGQLWAARSPKEHSTRVNDLEEKPLPIPQDKPGDTTDITRALYPRLLMLYNSQLDTWASCDDKDVLIHHPYVAISYRQSDFFKRGEDEKGKIVELEQKDALVEKIRRACLGQGYFAYWLDFECTGASMEEKNLDLYRIADVFRGASFTLITIADSQDDHSLGGWKSWGGRVWTLPEALLSPRMRYMVGDGPVAPVTLRQLANWAYEHYDEEVAIINGYSGKDALERLQRLMLLKNAIWRRSSGSITTPQTGEKAQVSQETLVPRSEFTAYPAEKVYALMGFFERRIMPNFLETELQALARLSMANDSDRIAERMVSMLPPKISPSACWYSDEDVYGANLWDVEPDVQVAGITKNGALVLDGCHAAAIRWKGFPDVAFLSKMTFKRIVCGSLPYLSWEFLLLGIVLVPFERSSGIAIIVISLILLLVSPKLIVYSHSGRVMLAQPWLIGVKGIITAEQASKRLYGSTKSSFPQTFYTASGSEFAVPNEQAIRKGDDSQVTLASGPEWAGNVYTLIDTKSFTIYYFRAERPPTVCVFTGREGGLGRFVLCSESCTINELHKETVLRMPSYISKSMWACDWLAIGGLDPPSHQVPIAEQVQIPEAPEPSMNPIVRRKTTGNTFLWWTLFTVLLGFCLIPSVHAASSPLGQIYTQAPLDPISLITLFFDDPEKDMLDRKGDMTLLTCFGLFANPATVWREYYSLHIGQGLQYFNPLQSITSTVEVGQVHRYLMSLSGGYDKTGMVVRLKQLKKRQWLPTSFSWEYCVIRPVVLAALISIASLSLDFFALGSLGALLFGQTIAIVKSIADGPLPSAGKETEEQSNVFFLANGVTVIVKAPGELFIEATSSRVFGKARAPEGWRLISTVLFMGGILLVGFSGMLFRISYLVAHVIQAALLVYAGDKPLQRQIVNRVEWVVDGNDIEKPLLRRRDTYVWVIKQIRKHPWEGFEWLKTWNLASGETFNYVETLLATPDGPCLENGLIISEKT